MYRMVRISELRSLDPAAWTRLLEQDQEIQGTRVTAVCHDKAFSSNLTRYQLSLDGYSEPISLIGKRTNALEIQFYQTIAPYLSVMAPKCWFSHLDGDDSWVVLSEVYDDWSPCHWAGEDVDAIIDDICDLHATFWDQEEHLDRFDWPYLLAIKGQRKGRQLINLPSLYEVEKQSVQSPVFQPRPESRSIFLSDHTARAAGPLMPRLIEAASGLEKMQLLGGWPNIFDDQHFLAAMDLLDDPIPMLQPLQQLPTTLLHGKLSPSNWQFNLFDEHHLINWENITVGPGIFDLVHFIEEFDFLSDEFGWRTRNAWPVLEETMIDSYLLNMGRRIGSDFNATAVRQAVPAARCLYVLTTWLPRFATWFETIPDDDQDWLVFNQMRDEELAEAGFDLMVGIRPYLTNLFQRFLSAYRLL
jgi:hypothetical protein